MESGKLEKLRLLKKGIMQLNRKLFVNHLILSFATSSILTILIDFFWDLRIIVFLIWLLFFTYVAYKLIFEIKFSVLRKRFDISQEIKDGNYEEIKEGFISLKLEQHKFKLNLKDCVYTLTDDFVFAFQSFKLLGIFIIDKTNPKNELEAFLSKFKKQRNLKFTAGLVILLVIIIFALKISLITLNQNFFNDDYIYEVQSITVGDTVLYDTSREEYIILSANFLKDNCPENEVVKFHCRMEFFDKIRLIHPVFINTSSNLEQTISDKLIGLYSYQKSTNEITLIKNNLKLKIKINPAPNNR